MPRVLLGDIAVERKETCKGSKAGYPIVGLEHLVPEEITLTNWSKDDKNTFTKVFRKGDILFGRRRAYLKKAAVAPFDGICSGDITVIQAKPERILPELLPFIIQNDYLFEFAVARSAGSLSPRVKWEHLKNFELELPDMDKQHEIAELLWAMDATKKCYQKLLNQTNEIVKFRFVELFGDPETNTKGWPIVQMCNLCSVGSSKRIYQSEQSSEGVPFWRISDLTNFINTGVATENLYIPEKRYVELQAQGQVPTAGDILVTSRGTLGLCYIVKADDKFYFQDGMISWLSQYVDGITPLYISYLFSMSGFRKQIDSMQAGSTVAYLSIAMIKKLKVMVPNEETQQQFAAFVHQIDKLKVELEQALSELSATYKRIIAETFG